jgi:hypothetical protein
MDDGCAAVGQPERHCGSNRTTGNHRQGIGAGQPPAVLGPEVLGYGPRLAGRVARSGLKSVHASKVCPEAINRP